mmetsp:Transcript_39656/g.123576  ORF Transcript_39656/g.123576 Transcript_39656/m.123576 type:complete len:224 (-) Transcript_39656:172-843(-)
MSVGVRSLLVVPSLEHVHVIPAVGAPTVGGRDGSGQPHDILRALPVARVVLRHAPGLSDLGPPLPWRVPAPLTHVEVHAVAGAVHRLRHQGVGVRRLQALRVAPVHLDPVDPPFGEDGRVLQPVVPRARTTPDADLSAGAGVQAKAQTLGVHIVYERPHAVGEVPFLWKQEAAGIPAAGPAVVEVEMPVASVVQPHFMEGVRGMLDGLLITIVEDGMIVLRRQ